MGGITGTNNGRDGTGTAPFLSRITIHPIKSLDGMDLQSAEISTGGCLLHDRELAITDALGNPIIGKTTPRVHLLRSSVDFDSSAVSFRNAGEAAWTTFRIPDELARINSYLSDFFGLPAVLHQNRRGRFLDKPDISGVTLLSTGSLEAVAGWFDGVGLEEIRGRFRASLEIQGVPAFWEDRLFAGKGRAVAYRIGDVTLFGMEPRARCIVPTRRPSDGEAYPGFARTFSKGRAANVPEGSRLEEYGHAYFLSVDCLLPAGETGKRIHVGDPLVIVGETEAPVPAP